MLVRRWTNWITPVLLIQSLWKIVWHFHLKLKMDLLYDPTVALIVTYPREMKTCTWFLIAASFVIAQSYKEPKYPSVVEQTMIQYSVKKEWTVDTQSGNLGCPSRKLFWVKKNSWNAIIIEMRNRLVVVRSWGFGRYSYSGVAWGVLLDVILIVVVVLQSAVIKLHRTTHTHAHTQNNSIYNWWNLNKMYGLYQYHFPGFDII